jgi:thiamine monophosphate synthase
MILPRLYAILDASCFPDCREMFAAAEELASAGVTLLQYRNKAGDARQMLEQSRELKRLIGGRVRLIMNDRADLCLAAEFDGVHVGQDDLSPEAARRILCFDLRLASEKRRRERGLQTSAAKAAHHHGTVNAALKRCATQSQEQEQKKEQEQEQKQEQEQEQEREREHVISHEIRGYLLGVSTHNPEQLASADKTSADYLAIGPVFATSSKENPDPVVGIEGVRRARELTRKPLVAIGGITRANAREVIAAGADAVAVISDLIREPRKSAEEFLAILG